MSAPWNRVLGIVTSTPSTEEVSAEALLARYRQRGEAESDFGAFKSTLAPTLSSCPRAKSHYQGRAIEEPYAEPDTFAANQAKLLLALLAANLLAIGADLISRDETVRMSRERFRTLLLKSAARVTFGSRRVTVIIQAARAHLWQRFRTALRRLPPVRGSPRTWPGLPETYPQTGNPNRHRPDRRASLWG